MTSQVIALIQQLDRGLFIAEKLRGGGEMLARMLNQDRIWRRLRLVRQSIQHLVRDLKPLSVVFTRRHAVSVPA